MDGQIVIQTIITQPYLAATKIDLHLLNMWSIIDSLDHYHSTLLLHNTYGWFSNLDTPLQRNDELKLWHASTVLN